MEVYISEFDGVDLKEAAETFKTPLYIYSRSIIEERFARFERVFSEVKHTVCFAVKANSNLSVLSLYDRLGAGFDVVSEGELRRLEVIGADFSKVVFSGVGKTKEEINFAVNKGLKLINFESLSELKVIGDICKSAGKSASVGFRLNPDISLDIHPYLITGLKESKFGMPFSDASEAWEIIKNNDYLSLEGVTCHVGSGGTDIVKYEEAFKAVISAAKYFESLGAKIKFLDFGGGFGVSYSGYYEELDMLRLKGVIENLLKASNYELIFEPGKFLVAEAGLLLTTVLYVKKGGSQKFIVVDAGMNDLIRPSLYNAPHKILCVGNQKSKSPQLEAVDVVGPVCEGGCFIGRGVNLPLVPEGGLLAVKDCGAYCFSMASRYNSRRLPAEIMAYNGHTILIRRRDSYDDLFSHDIV
ncbi:MAG: diaminopimelate decarboxylase [Candidatus Dadabacteria bacterium]|nr:MAG: diaminopimelate decarboxylase [Candidatus Dadabacteria bacterium]